jgi:hypothetical protein
MTWAVSMTDRQDPGGILYLVEDRHHAESLAEEIRCRGVRAVACEVREPAWHNETRRPAFTLTDLVIEDPIEARRLRSLRRT